MIEPIWGTTMLETFALQTSQDILTSLVRSLYAALNRLGGHSDDIDVATPQTTNQAPMGGG
jgi:hypothetical protein